MHIQACTHRHENPRTAGANIHFYTILLLFSPHRVGPACSNIHETLERNTVIHPNCVKSTIILHLHPPAAIVKAVSTSCITLFPVFHPLFSINISFKDIFPNNRLLSALCCWQLHCQSIQLQIVLHIKTCISLFLSLCSPSCSLRSRLHLGSLCLQAQLSIVLRLSLVVTLSSAPSYYHIDKWMFCCSKTGKRGSNVVYCVRC